MLKPLKTLLFLGMFITVPISGSIWAWSWDSADNVLPSLREDLDKEIDAYRRQVGSKGLKIHDRILILDRIIGNYKPLGLNVVDLETERSRLILQDKQQQLRSIEAQDEATVLYERGISEYKEGRYRDSLVTIRDAERRLPDDDAIKELRRKLTGITPVIESETSELLDGQLIRLAVTRYLQNDPKRALNALIYAKERQVARPEITRLKALVEKNHPEVEMPRLDAGIKMVDYKLQATLEAIYDGRYLTAIAECTDVLDLEPKNVLALTRLGSAYFAMNEKTKAKKIWTQALQLDPKNQVLRKFLYGAKRTLRVEKKR